MRLLILLAWLIVAFSVKAQVTITTTSSTTYQTDRSQAIYPAFVDNLPYQSWTEAGSKDFFQLQATGGSNYEWELLSGNLPLGLSLTRDGKIQGTPSQEGTYSFTVKVTSGQISATKSLTMVAEPYRSHWMSEAKFGVMVAWGAFAEPKIVNAPHIPNFEARATGFNAQEWVDKTIQMGGKVLNVVVKGGDAIRLWPSTTPSQLNMKTSRNFIQELIDACHAKGIKFVAYFAPDMFWNPGNTDYAIADSTNSRWNEWGTLNEGLIRELVAMGIDGLWVDVGGTAELYASWGVKEAWFDWKVITPLIRSLNPYVTLANNPGIRRKGTILKYPDMDVVVYEGGMGTSALELDIANPYIMPKKMAVEVDNLLDVGWSWEPSKGVPYTAKSAAVVIENIKANWENGATVMLNWPVRTDGKFIAPEYEAKLDSIGAFVKAHQPWVASPKLMEKAGKIELKAQAGTRIFYTIDGKIPRQQSLIYSNPFTALTQVKAVAVTKEGNRSRVVESPKAITESLLGYKSLFSAASGNISRTDTVGYYRGMRIVVRDTPVLLAGVSHAGQQTPHQLLIKEYATDYPIVAFEGKKDAGSDYVLIPETHLEAGHSYIIAFKEEKGHTYVANPLTDIPPNTELRIVERFNLSQYGDRDPVTPDGFGALLNLKYKTIPSEKSKNIALGKPVAFLSNGNGSTLGPSSGCWYTENAVDGNPNTVAIAGGEYGYTVRVDLEQVQPVSTIKLDFHSDYYATAFEIYSSVDGVTLQKRLRVDNAAGKKNFVFELGKINTRYVYVKALSPNAAHQVGTQMGIRELQIFK